MSRSCYNDDEADSQEAQWAMIRWRGAVTAAIRGKRGQAFLRDLITALDALPEKKLIANHLHRGGKFCAIGAVGAMRRKDMRAMDHISDPDDDEAQSDRNAMIATAFNISEALVREIEFINDEAGWHDTSESRWTRVRQWATARLSG